ncbi:MAG: FAD-dependent pyridine nucleotide-disulfide oxidoreductase [Frankiales bacterium]|nr:FAD-dependent pyridine nucleotide-disulfide oxidoreductase [Frankiales bacterium]
MSRELPLPEHVRVAIVGSGFAGLGAAVRLLQEGREDFVVLERAEDLGGTWRDNTYPGCACDVQSHLYSFSFAPNPDWSRAFSGASEIHAYLQRVATDHGVRPHLRYGAELLAAAWDGAAQLWRLTTSRGDLTADVLISGTGPLSDPLVPELPGLASFTGRAFHSARWDHGHDLTGRKVAVVGTGASAIQFVPVIAQQAGSLVVFQRTPPWVLPRYDRAIKASARAKYRADPRRQRRVRAAIYWFRELNLLAFTGGGRMSRLAEKMARRHLAKQVPDPVLRDKLTPSYRIGCKRILLSDDYYPALIRSDVEVVTAPVVEVRPHSVIDGDGREHEVDTLVFGTGFHVTDQPIADRLRGTDGRLLSEVWGPSPEAYLGTTVPGFPNLFLLLGPNTVLGHTSVVYMIEAQLAYVMDALRTMDARGVSSVDVRARVVEAFNADLQGKLQGTVWNAGGCKSWYLDAAGRNSSLWPTYTFRFKRSTRRFDPESYVLQRRPTDSPPGR